MKGGGGTDASTLILCLRAFLRGSPPVVPASTVPCRCTAPVRARIASRSVVLPLWNGPTSAMHLGPLGPLSLSPITASLDFRDRALDRSAQLSFQGEGGIGKYAF